MRYICEHCGASGKPDRESPPYYNCHVCDGNRCMWPEPIMRKVSEDKLKMTALRQQADQISEDSREN